MTAAITIDDVFQQIDRIAEQLKRLEQSIVPNVSARVYNSSAHAAIANSVISALVFDSASFDSGDVFPGTIVTPSSRLVAPIKGIYTIASSIATSATTVGRVMPRVLKNGITELGRGPSLVNGSGETSLNLLASLAAGDYVELQLWNLSGASITPFASEAVTWFAMKLESI